MIYKLFILILLLPLNILSKNISKNISLDELVALSQGRTIITRIGTHTLVEYTLLQDSTNKFRALMNNLKNDPYKEWEIYLEKAKKALKKALPSDLNYIIKKMSNSNEPTALIIHNMPIDDYIPATPTNGNRPPCKHHDSKGAEIINAYAKGYISEAAILGTCGLLKALPDYDEREKDGTYINQIIPCDDDKSKSEASSFGSETPFEPHTKNVYQEPPLKIFSLLCLRGDPKVATRIIFLDNLLKYIKSDLAADQAFNNFLQELQKPQFAMRTGPSFERGDLIERVLPILTKNSKGETVFRFNANPGRIIGQNPEAIKTIDYLKDVLKRPDFKKNCYSSFYLKSGDFLIFNNWQAMHARDAFTIDTNNWRWLQRCYFMVN